MIYQRHHFHGISFKEMGWTNLLYIRGGRADFHGVTVGNDFSIGFGSGCDFHRLSPLFALMSGWRTTDSLMRLIGTVVAG